MLFLGLFAVAAVALLVFSERARGVTAILVVVFLVAGWVTNRRLRKLAAERVGEDLCSFSRAFDRHSPAFDPWVVRAVWEALQPYRSFRGGVAPMRPSDRLESFMDTDDLDMGGGLKELAARSGRTLDNHSANPFFGRVVTVGDLVAFLEHQPLTQRPNRPLQPTSGGKTEVE